MPNSLYKKFLRNYYLTGFFDDFVFAYAIYNVFFSIHKLSIFQISLLLGWWALSALIFEIPTGALADRWNRKKMLTLAPIFKSGCFLIWFFAGGNFYLYALGFTFWAASESFVSGTTQALLYDHLKYFNKIEDYERIAGKKSFYSHIALATSLISGGFIANYNLDWAILFSIIPLILSAFFANLIQEAPKEKTTEEIHYIGHIKIAFREIKTNKVLPYLMAYFGVLFITFGTLEEFDQLYYYLVKLPIYAFGIAGFIWSLLNAIGTYYAYKFKDKTWIFYFFPLISAICLLIVSISPSVYVIVLLWTSYLFAAPLLVLMESKIQHNIKSASRATVTSINIFLLNLFGALLAPIFGLISKIWNLQAIYLTVAIILFIFTFWLFFARNRFAIRMENAQNGEK
jgi:MFS family permease